MGSSRVPTVPIGSSSGLRVFFFLNVFGFGSAVSAWANDASCGIHIETLTGVLPLGFSFFGTMYLISKRTHCRWISVPQGHVVFQIFNFVHISSFPGEHSVDYTHPSMAKFCENICDITLPVPV